MESFKIGLKELLILILLSVPIGFYLYMVNYSKINYETKNRRGYAATENFCETYQYEKKYLQNEGDIESAIQKYVNSQGGKNSKFSGRIKGVVRNDTGTYIISVKGRVGEELEMAEFGNKVLDEISESELSAYNNFYKTVKLHCKSGVYQVFKIVPMEKISQEFSITRSYKNAHLLILFALPFTIFYLFLIILKYFNYISINKKNK